MSNSNMNNNMNNNVNNMDVNMSNNNNDKNNVNMDVYVIEDEDVLFTTPTAHHNHEVIHIDDEDENVDGNVNLVSLHVGEEEGVPKVDGLALYPRHDDAHRRNLRRRTRIVLSSDEENDDEEPASPTQPRRQRRRFAPRRIDFRDDLNFSMEEIEVMTRRFLAGEPLFDEDFVPPPVPQHVLDAERREMKRYLHNVFRTRMDHVRDALVEMEELVELKEYEIYVLERVPLSPDYENGRHYYDQCAAYQLESRREECSRFKVLLNDMQAAMDSLLMDDHPIETKVLEMAKSDPRVSKLVRRPRLSLSASIEHVQRNGWNAETEYLVDMRGILTRLLEDGIPIVNTA